MVDRFYHDSLSLAQGVFKRGRDKATAVDLDDLGLTLSCIEFKMVADDVPAGDAEEAQLHREMHEVRRLIDQFVGMTVLPSVLALLASGQTKNDAGIRINGQKRV